MEPNVITLGSSVSYITGKTIAAKEFLNVDIMDTDENILAMEGLDTGTIAFATDTHDLYIFTREGVDVWRVFEDV